MTLGDPGYSGGDGAPLSGCALRSSGAAMREPGYSDALRYLREAAGGDLQHAIDAACESLPAWDPIVYLGDFSGEVLFPLTPGFAEEDVAGSMAGGSGPRISWRRSVKACTNTPVTEP